MARRLARKRVSGDGRVFLELQLSPAKGAKQGALLTPRPIQTIRLGVYSVLISPGGPGSPFRRATVNDGRLTLRSPHTTP